jgi:hypothetical protein
VQNPSIRNDLIVRNLGASIREPCQCVRQKNPRKSKMSTLIPSKAVAWMLPVSKQLLLMFCWRDVWQVDLNVLMNSCKAEFEEDTTKSSVI